MYVNGVLQSSSWDSNGNATYTGCGTSSCSFEIGHWYGTSTGGSNWYWFNGSIDEIMIFNKSLSASVITAIYNNQSARFKPQGIITVGQRLFALRNESINLTLPIYSTNQGTSLEGRIGYWDIGKGYNALDSGMVAYWHMDEASWGNNVSGEIKDASGLNNASAIGGANTTSGGMYYRGGRLNGSSYLTKPYSATDKLDFGTGNFSISAWVNPLAAGDNVIFMTGIPGSGGGGNKGYYLRVQSDNTVLFVAGVYTTSFCRTSINKIIPGQWNHVVAVRTNTGVNISINGVDSGHVGCGWGSGTADYANAVASSTCDRTIGISNKPCGDTNPVTGWLNGTIDELMIWNRSLTASEMKELYTKGRAAWSYSSWAAFSGNTSSGHVAETTTTNIFHEVKMLPDSNKFYTPYVG
jgi:hypothetical protein